MKKSTAITPTDPATTATRRPQADVTRDAHDHEPEDERLEQPHPDVLHEQPLGDGGPIDAARDMELEAGHEPAADDPDEVGNHGQDRRHDDPGQQARNDELADRVRAKRPERVDLIGHGHRAEFGGDA
jgi:hypothetical protein